MLQNADDTDYPEDVDARLCLEVFRGKPQRLEVTSNEKGFSYDNVESICDALRSTKTKNPNTIGEKGIGFKSVFKVASKVRIRSNYYSFEFDTTANTALDHVSMIAPIWVPYDTAYTDESKYKGSHMKLFFKSDFDDSLLVSELMRFDFAFLLFSRKICKLRVKVFSEEGKLAQWRWGRYQGERDGIHEIRVSQQRVFLNDDTPEEEKDAPEDEEDQGEYEDSTPERSEDEFTSHGETSDSDEDTAEGNEDNLENGHGRKEHSSTKYFLFQHSVEDMPELAKREGATHREIYVAFPFNSKGGILQSQPTFAFLPVRHHGFTVGSNNPKFIIMLTHTSVRHTCRFRPNC